MSELIPKRPVKDLPPAIVLFIFICSQSVTFNYHLIKIPVGSGMWNWYTEGDSVIMDINFRNKAGNLGNEACIMKTCHIHIIAVIISNVPINTNK